MQGLLGTSFDDPKTMATLQLAAGLLGGRTFGQGMSQGLLGYGDALQKAKQQAMQAQLQQAQIEETKAQAAQRAAQAAKAQRDAQEQLRIQGVIRNAFQPTQSIDANAASGVAGPRPEALQAVGQRQPVDYQGLIAQGVPADLAKNLAEAGNWGQQKVARTVETTDEQGRPVTMQVDELGRPVGRPMPKWLAPIQVNRGGSIDFMDPATMTQRGSLPVTRSPDSLASTGVQMRGQNMVDARAREANAIGGKPPAGYRFTPDGNLEAIPGGPADIKAGELGAKRERAEDAAVYQADRIMSKVDQALAKVGPTTAGIGGAIADFVPLGSRVTDYKNLEADLATIKANLGFAELQAMREASPTGGALGQVAVQELIALQSTVASLDQGQDPKQLKQRLGEVRQHYQNWKNAVMEARGQATQKPAAPAGGVKFLGFE